MLQKLLEYANDAEGEQLPPLYEMTPVAHIVLINHDGSPVSPKPIPRMDETTARGRRGLDMKAPVVQRAAGVKPLLLADNGEYTFGRARDPQKQERATRAHQAYVELLSRCAEATREPSAAAVQRFYQLGGVEQLELADDWDHGLKVTFEVRMEDGTRQRPIDLPAVQGFWLEENLPKQDEAEQCLVCGQRKPVLDRLQGKIKGIRGGQSAGTSIISANEEAYESYGLKASKTAPTCRDCGEGFTRGLNKLLEHERTRLYMGDTTFVFWTENGEFDLGSFMRNPDPQEVGALLSSVETGRAPTEIDPANFYAAALSASGGRAVVRDWMDTTVGNAEVNIARWFQMQGITDPRIEDPEGRHPRPLSLFQLAGSTAQKLKDGRPDWQKLTPSTPHALFRTALQGTPLPMDTAFQAVRRNRAEQSVSRPRAALIKLVLLSQETQTMEEDYMVALDTEHPSPAYHCGRLLAVIERTQKTARPRIKATIVDRFYGAASSTPAMVFGNLLRGTQPHLSILNRDNQGAYRGLQRELEEVCGQIGDFPATLTLKEQALFSLGYYHQRADNTARMLSRRNTNNDREEEQQE